MRLLAVPLALGLALAARVAGAEPTLDAELLNEEVHAKTSSAVVRVTVGDIELVDPDEVGPEPKEGQGHLRYRLDGGPVIATTARKLAFHELAPGQHNITVLLAGNDLQPLGPQETIPVLIPTAVLAR
jgi:hypothetical protein